MDVPWDIVLRWTPGELAAPHDVGGAGVVSIDVNVIVLVLCFLRWLLLS
ncbi:MAG: hypothetical protein ACYSW7_00010 [Planctomycetota bacterium]